jgi:ribonuclease HI
MTGSLPLLAFVDGSIDNNKTEDLSVGSCAAVIVRSRRALPSSPEPVVDRVVVYAEHQIGRESVTNNRMELSAILLLTSAMTFFDEQQVTFFSDSQWCLGALFNPEWTVKKNLDLVNLLKERIESSEQKVVGLHVKGHAGSFLNVLADYAALRARAQQKTIHLDVPAHPETETKCLLCANYPCKAGKRVNKKDWTLGFSYLKRKKYRVCPLFTPYVQMAWTGLPGSREEARR